jgi:hypothetical protein
MEHITYIIYQDADGLSGKWGVCANGDKDTSMTLREHLEKWRPDCTFIRAEYWINDQRLFAYDEKPDGYKRAFEAKGW